jgi:hypothetical protein
MHPQHPMKMFAPVTLEERDQLVKAARDAFNAVPSTLQHLIADTDTDFIDLVESAIELEQPAVITPPASMTPAEKTAQDADLRAREWFPEAFEKENLPPAFRKLAEEEERAIREEFLRPARAARNTLAGMVEDAVREAVAKLAKSASAPRPETDRPGIVPRMAAVAAQEDPNSPLTRFLTSYVRGDEAGMRQVARQLATADAA